MEKNTIIKVNYNKNGIFYEASLSEPEASTWKSMSDKERDKFVFSLYKQKQISLNTLKSST